MIQSHLKKLFAGIHNVLFDDENKQILAMKSIDGEIVTLKNPVVITENVEVRHFPKAQGNFNVLSVCGKTRLEFSFIA